MNQEDCGGGGLGGGGGEGGEGGGGGSSSRALDSVERKHCGHRHRGRIWLSQWPHKNLAKYINNDGWFAY